MTEQEIGELKRLISRTDLSANQKVDWIANFIDDKEKLKEMYNPEFIKDMDEALRQVENGETIKVENIKGYLYTNSPVKVTISEER